MAHPFWEVIRRIGIGWPTYRRYTPPLVGAHYVSVLHYDGSMAAAAPVVVNIVVFATCFLLRRILQNSVHMMWTIK